MAEEEESVVQAVQVQADSAGVATLTLNRPAKFNALNPALFHHIPAAIRALDSDPAVRVIVVNANGRHFCSGIDLSHFASEFASNEASECLGRQKEKFRRDVKQMQDAFNAFEECRKPVIAAIHGACIGGGIDMITACDLRYCTEDAAFSVKEVDVAITADLGTLQRLPRLVGHGTAMELALTGRRFSGTEAKSLGLVQAVLPSKPELDAHVHTLAAQIAAKSPLAVMGTKTVLVKSRDLTVAQGLEYVALWNAAMLASHDLQEVLVARVEKEAGGAAAVQPVCLPEEGEGVVVAAAASAGGGGGGGGVKRQIFEEEEEEPECHQMFAETPVTVTTLLPVKRRAGRPKKHHPVSREKMIPEESEASEAGRNWPDSEVYALIDVRGEMEPDFVKNAKKQGVDSWSNLHARMVASVQGFNRTPVACKRKFNSLYKQYKDDRIANISNNDRHECKFYASLDNWWHFNGSAVKHVSINCTTPPPMDTLKSEQDDVNNKCRKRETQSA